MRGDASAPLLRGLPPVQNPAARVLILGSMPGAASLAAAQYYAHPRNLFWPLMADLIGFDPGAPYAARIEALTAAGIALWDVIGACRRPGSLDARIAANSIEVNDFPDFLARHRQLTTVCFNGATAAASWRRLVLPRLGARDLAYRQLPSTSPATAAVPPAPKRTAWLKIADSLRTG